MKRITRYDVKLVKEECKLYELSDTMVESTQKAGEVIQMVCDINSSTVEKFGMLCLNRRNEIVGIHIIHVGGVGETIVDPKAVFQRALLNNASAIVAFHNHPSGSAEPSINDIQITEKLKAAGEFLEIKVLDHVIIYGMNKYTSLMERGLM
jgi:DNA repair protein RadC